MKKVVVVGGGPAGMMAAIVAAKQGREVVLLEKNEKLGKKLFITGKGRCNITNACDVSDLFENIISNSKFLYSAIYTFPNDRVMSFFEENGLPIKIERGNRVFPKSDKSSDVIKNLTKICKTENVKIMLNTKVMDLLAINQKCIGVLLSDNTRLYCDDVIVCTGGASYSSTGSDGKFFDVLKKYGHTVKKLRPGLTGMTSDYDKLTECMGLTLKNISIQINTKSNKRLYSGFGELLFTHYGVSGPLVLSASSILGDYFEKEELVLHIDIKPYMTYEELDARFLREFSDKMNVSIKNVLTKVIPKSLIEPFLDKCKIQKDTKANAITKEKRKIMVDTLKDFSIILNGLRGMDEAIITRGGINVKEINPSTLESKIVNNLYFAGELIDVDALTGGFNLQIAWSTGFLAGMLGGN